MGARIAKFSALLALEDKLSGATDKVLAQNQKKFQRGFDKISKTVKVGMVAAGASVLTLGAASVKVADQVDRESKRIAASLGRPTTEAQKFRKVIRDVYGGTAVDSLEEAGDAVQRVTEQLVSLGVTSERELTKATKAAIALQKTFRLDVTESTQAAAALMDNFGLSADQAFDFVTSGLQRGLNRSGDFLDSISEYAVQFKNAGADAGQFFSILESGLQTGVLGTDKAADLFKEFRVRILDGSTATTEALQKLFGGIPEGLEQEVAKAQKQLTKLTNEAQRELAKGNKEAADAIQKEIAQLQQSLADVTEGYGGLGESADSVMARLRSGQLDVADALKLVQDRLRQVNDPVERMQLGVALLGTQFEDLGDEAFFALDLAGTKMEDLDGSTDGLNAQFDTLGGFFKGIRKQGVLALEEIGAAMIPVAKAHVPEIRAGFEKLAELAPKIGELFATGLDIALNIIVPLIEKTVNFVSLIQDAIPFLTKVGLSLAAWKIAAGPAAKGIGIVSAAVKVLLGLNAPSAILGTATSMNAVTAAAPGAAAGIKTVGVASSTATPLVGLLARALGPAVLVGALILAGKSIWSVWEALKALNTADLQLTASIERQAGQVDFLKQRLGELNVTVDESILKGKSEAQQLDILREKIAEEAARRRELRARLDELKKSQQDVAQTADQTADASQRATFAAGEQSDAMVGASDSAGTYQGSLALLVEQQQFATNRAPAYISMLDRITHELNQATRAANQFAQAQNQINNPQGFAGGGVVPFAEGGVVPFAKGGNVPAMETLKRIGVQALARGGRARPRFALVGEEGPELRSDLGGNHITPARATDEIFNAVASRIVGLLGPAVAGPGGDGGGPRTISVSMPFSVSMPVTLTQAVNDPRRFVQSLRREFIELVDEEMESRVRHVLGASGAIA